ncbi:MAG: NUDIX domain-containing protein [Bacteroidota bacterium]|nr:NUDIX domain-containing protein [Bacteroidota bacterium]
MSQKYKVFINGHPKLVTENWEKFCCDYVMIEAAGGVVYNQKGEVLMIFRNGKWDLPKGKLEVEETIEQCAIREVIEESGVANLSITKKLKDTYHTYELKGEAVLKRTYWFEMFTDFNGELVPQTKEGITKVFWVNKKEIADKLKCSYPNIVELLQ